MRSFRVKGGLIMIEKAIFIGLFLGALCATLQWVCYWSVYSIASLLIIAI